MKNAIKFVLWIVYLIGIFYIRDILILVIFLLINTILLIIVKKDIEGIIKRLIILLPFLIFTTIMNILFGDILFGICVGIRLLIAYIVTDLYANIMTIRETTKAIEKILTPLKIIKVDIESVSLMISISVSILPNLINEFEQKYYALKSKTIKITYKNLLLVVKTTLIEILLKSNAFEETLIVKGYGE